MWFGTQHDDHCKYRNELCYKSPLCGMLSCSHDVFLLSISFIVNISTSCVIKVHEKYVFFHWVSQVYARFNIKDIVSQGEGFCNSPGENPM